MPADFKGWWDILNDAALVYMVLGFRFGWIHSDAAYQDVKTHAKEAIAVSERATELIERMFNAFITKERQRGK